MNKDKNRIGKLIYLYMCLIFQKATIIILAISFILMTLGIILFSNPQLKEADYISAINEIHTSYFQQSILLIQIFNIIIITSVVISINISSSSFDLFFISYSPRYKICLAKLISIILFSLLIVMLEMILLYTVAYIRYDKLIFIKEMFISNIFIFVSLIFEALLSLALSTFASSIFVPMMVLFISVIIKVIINNYNKINEFISLFYPVMDLNQNYIIVMDNFLVICIWIILLFFLYVSIYNVKEMKNI